jgi:ATP-dependent DNA ligase
MKTLAELQATCREFGIAVDATGRPSKEAYVRALRQHIWERDHLGQPLPEQIEPMLLGNWDDLTPAEAEPIENDHHSWGVQEKKDGVRVLVHIGTRTVRLTGRTVSEVTYRLSEHQDNVPHLTTELDHLAGTILDVELVCPKARIDTGSCTTENALQAAVAILATDPTNAARIQDEQDARLELHAFDVLRSRGRDLTSWPLFERLAELARVVEQAGHPHLHLVPTAVVGKRNFHERVIAEGGEGTVWKQLNQPYSPARRVYHWLKRKRGVEVEAFVTGFKTGSADRGHRHLVGAVEFSVHRPDGSIQPLAWVSGFTDNERRAMTVGENGSIRLNPAYLGRRAIVVGQDESARSRRLRHARLKAWVES